MTATLVKETLAYPEPTADNIDSVLSVAAEVLLDLERVRIANENRLRQMTRSTEDLDGKVRGFGMNELHPDVARLAEIIDMLAKAEKAATKHLEKTLTKHPLYPWIQSQKGIGAKQGARLLAAIGDPYWRKELHLEDDIVIQAGPRTVSALWAYCGLHTLPIMQASDGGMQEIWIAAKRAKGFKSNWSPVAKMRAYLVAESVIKAGHPGYRAVYDKRRAATETRVHAIICVRCGPSGKPAQPGSPWSKGHQFADALRIVSKEILKDLWTESKRLHSGSEETTISYGTVTKSDHESVAYASGGGFLSENVELEPVR